MEKTSSVLERAGRWFLESGIQEKNGGVARYYRSDLGKNTLVSTEITGYAASFLLYVYEQTGLAEYRDAGMRAARFLACTAWDANLGVFPFEHSSNGVAASPLSYFFDSGIIVRGLLSAWRATRDSHFLDTALSAGRGMLLHFRGFSAIHPILTLPERQPRAYEKRWSTSPGCYQLKASMAWHDLYEAAGDRDMLAAYEASLQAALATQHEFLSAESDPAKVMDRLHAYAYFLEGLLPRATDPGCARALALGVDRIASQAEGIAPSFARSDVFAQLLRLRLYASELGVRPLDEWAAGREAQAAAAFQLQSDDSRIAGGFGFGTRGGAIMPFVNPVSTAFCAQALTWWEQYSQHRFQPGRHALV